MAPLASLLMLPCRFFLLGQAANLFCPASQKAGVIPSIRRNRKSLQAIRPGMKRVGCVCFHAIASADAPAKDLCHKLGALVMPEDDF